MRAAQRPTILRANRATKHEVMRAAPRNRNVQSRPNVLKIQNWWGAAAAESATPAFSAGANLERWRELPQKKTTQDGAKADKKCLLPKLAWREAPIKDAYYQRWYQAPIKNAFYPRWRKAQKKKLTTKNGAKHRQRNAYYQRWRKMPRRKTYYQRLRVETKPRGSSHVPRKERGRPPRIRPSNIPNIFTALRTIFGCSFFLGTLSLVVCFFPRRFAPYVVVHFFHGASHHLWQYAFFSERFAPSWVVCILWVRCVSRHL